MGMPVVRLGKAAQRRGGRRSRLHCGTGTGQEDPGKEEGGCDHVLIC